MEIKQAEFVITVASPDKILQSTNYEFAFVGRSNAGKSSLINALTRNKNLAKTSSTAGLTKNINYFKINKGQFYFVDLPGYGFHKAGKNDEDRWAELIESYLLNSKALKCVFVLTDIRHKASENDLIMLKFLHYYQIPFVILATKADKVKKSEIEKLRLNLSNSLALGVSDVIITSAEKKQGLNSVLSIIEQYL